MKSAIVRLAGAIALLGVTSVGFAQAPENRQRPAAKPQRAAPPPTAAPAPRAARPQIQRPAERAPSRRPATVQRSRPQQPAAVQRAPQQRAAERVRAQQQRAERRSSQQQRAERSRGEQNRQARDRSEQDKLRQRQAQPPAKSVGPKQVEKDPRQPDIAGKENQRAQPVARIQATDRQRREVRQRLFRQRNVQRIPRDRLGASFAIGSHIPRRHRLHRFTPALLAYAPFYAAYSYIVVDDTICVVDPESYVVVDVIPSSIEQAESAPAGPPTLALSPAQMRFIYASVPKDRARTDVRIRLALGAEIPRNVELFAFPEDVLARVPEASSFRYIVVENDVVIVDPAGYGIVLVISE